MRPHLALIEAAKDGDCAAAEDALRRGAEANAVVDGWTALVWAAQEGYEEIVDLLLDADADVNFSTSEGITPLIQAIAWSHLVVAERLLLRGADVNHRNVSDRGGTALHTAAVYGLVECIRLLLLYGADSTAHNTEGQTPYDTAIECGETEAAALLTVYLTDG